MTSLPPQNATIKFFGVGEAGLSVLGLLPPGPGAAIGVSASPDLLERLPELRHIQLNGPLPRRLPRGDLDAARSAAEGGAHEFRSAAEAADVVFVIASLGGATG